VSLSAGRNDEALVHLERAMHCAPRNPSYLLRYGQTLAASGRRRDALALAIDWPQCRFQARLRLTH